MKSLKDKHIILGITGSIACYKAADLASKLAQTGALVDVILTKAAQEFISPLTFQSVTGRKAYTETDLWSDQGHVLHISLAKQSDLLVIAPATANTIAKMAHGQADNLLTITALAAECPVLVAPAMDGGMYSHAATQTNLKTLEERGVTIVGPEAGHLASGMTSVGRMTEPLDLLGHIRLRIGENREFANQTVLISAGPTQEPLDPVRYLTNRSSGKQGFALAQAALDLGAKVILVAGPNQLPTPVGAERVDVRTAEDMYQAIKTHSQKADILIMTAAVADFKPDTQAAQKLKKSGDSLNIKLARTKDILKEIGQEKEETGYPKLIVGFAAESENLLENAQAKLKSKNLDLIVANNISADDAGFGVDTNRVTLLFADGRQEELALMSKFETAEHILQSLMPLIK